MSLFLFPLYHFTEFSSNLMLLFYDLFRRNSTAAAVEPPICTTSPILTASHALPKLFVEAVESMTADAVLAEVERALLTEDGASKSPGRAATASRTRGKFCYIFKI